MKFEILYESLMGDMNAQTVIHKFRKYANYIDGLWIDITENRQEGGVTLDNIDVDANMRGQGIGSKALSVLIKLADDYNVRIDLDMGGDSEIDLPSWYSKHGFNWDGSKMVRYPKQNLINNI